MKGSARILFKVLYFIETEEMFLFQKSNRISDKEVHDRCCHNFFFFRPGFRDHQRDRHIGTVTDSFMTIFMKNMIPVLLLQKNRL